MINHKDFGIGTREAGVHFTDHAFFLGAEASAMDAYARLKDNSLEEGFVEDLKNEFPRMAELYASLDESLRTHFDEIAFVKSAGLPDSTRHKFLPEEMVDGFATYLSSWLMGAHQSSGEYDAINREVFSMPSDLDEIWYLCHAKARELFGEQEPVLPNRTPEEIMQELAVILPERSFYHPVDYETVRTNHPVLFLLSAQGTDRNLCLNRHNAFESYCVVRDELPLPTQWYEAKRNGDK